jgi:7-cyano-7-deazaguanine synthase in queuosine biosynthesis
MSVTSYHGASVQIDVRETRIFVAWQRANAGPPDGGYTVELPVEVVRAPAVALVALPVLIAMSRHGGTVRVRPAFLEGCGISAIERSALQRTLFALAMLVQRTVLALCDEVISVNFEIDLEGIPTSNFFTASNELASPSAPPAGLLFGGGVESLLSLARMRERGPVRLIGLRGPGWRGSDREHDKRKLEYDEQLAKQLGLELLSVDTDAYLKMVDFQAAWAGGSKVKSGFANTVTFSPLVVSMAAPLIASGAIASVHLGSENEHSGYLPGYCLSGEFLTELSQAVAPLARFVPEVLELGKPAIVEELWRRAPDLARLQRSCVKTDKRWCGQCEKCFRNYVLLVAAGIDPALVELDGRRLLLNLPQYTGRLLRAVGLSSYHQKVYLEATERALSSGHFALATMLAALIPLGAVVRGREKVRSLAQARAGTP